MKAEFLFDQDPRYGWASVDLEGATTGMIIVHAESGSFGFNFCERDKTMKPICTCHAWSESECGCTHLEPDYWRESDG